MFKQRVLTACVLIPLTLLVLFSGSPFLFWSVSSLVFLAAAWEWSGLMGLRQTRARLFYVCGFFLVQMSSMYLNARWVFAGAAVWWLLAILLIVRYPGKRGWWRDGLSIRGIIGFVVLVPCWLALNFIFIQPQGASQLLTVFLLVWGADTGAYLTGRVFGKHRLAPAVSPGKSWEGLAGGLMLSLLISLVLLAISGTHGHDWPRALLIAMITVIFSVIGDLFESMVKRSMNLKDSGSLLPGHGGLLDRIDSLTAALPVFAFACMQWR